MRYLFYVLKQHFNQTFWKLKYGFGDLQPRMLFCAISGASASERRSPNPLILADVCQVTAQSTPENNVYYFPLELLSHLLELTRNGLSSLDNTLAFGPRVSHSYRMLVQQKDEPALLLFMLWLRLLCREECWWVTARARIEYAAVSWLLTQSKDVRIKMVIQDPDVVLLHLDDDEAGNTFDCL